MVSVYDSKACFWALRPSSLFTPRSFPSPLLQTQIRNPPAYTGFFSPVPPRSGHYCPLPRKLPEARLVYGLLGHPLCSDLVLFLSPVTNSNPKPTGLYRILFTGSTQRRSRLPTSKKVAGKPFFYPPSCRKTLFYPSSCRIFSSAHFGGAWHYRVVLNNPFAGRLCY